jgi:S-adenosylmethionine:tRNA ribosyltransferase-isomerase
MPPTLQLSDLDFDLPEELIAQHPCAQRDACRLLVVGQAQDDLREMPFHDLIRLLRPGDLLVRNVTRVLPARLTGVRPETGGRAEVLLLEPAAGGTWWALARPARRLRRGCQLRLSDGTRVTIVEEGAAGQRRLQFPSSQSAEQVARRCGEMPLPPYLRRPAAPTDSEDYQTVYARVDGSIAAPTAGLHFTNDLLARLQEQGIDLVDVVLHVGLGTFEPLRGADPLQHSMHRESIEVPADLPARLAKVRASSGRIVAVGTTVARVLESLALWQEDPNDQRVALEPRGAVLSGSTRIFLHPPYA